MIEVKIIPKKHKLEMTGHAQHDEPGKDIVCAAASMLFYTLAETVTSYPDKVFMRAPYCDSGNKNIIICTPKNEWQSCLDVIYQTILNGLLLLEQNYPDNIKIAIED